MTGILSGGGASHVGGRTTNEDRWFVRPLGLDRLAFGVADGMGGHDDGEIAAQIAVDTAKAHAADSALASVVHAAHAAVGSRAASRRSNMGTTLTLGRISLGRNGTVLEVAHVGDSRAGLLRGGRFAWLTEDQAIGGALLQAVGIQDGKLSVATRRWRLRPGDRVVLVSDGVSGVFRNESQMASALSGLAAASASDAARDLVAAVIATGRARDNVTCVLGDVAGFV